MVIGKRALLVTIVIAAIGIAACVVKTTPVHHRHRPAASEKHKKHKPVKHKKHKKHKDNHQGDQD